MENKLKFYPRGWKSMMEVGEKEKERLKERIE